MRSVRSAEYVPAKVAALAPAQKLNSAAIVPFYIALMVNKLHKRQRRSNFCTRKNTAHILRQIISRII